MEKNQKNTRAYCTKEDAALIEKCVNKYRGTKNNPLTGLTFNQILQRAKKEFN